MGGGSYEIRIKGRLSDSLLAVFEGLTASLEQRRAGAAGHVEHPLTGANARAGHQPPGDLVQEPGLVVAGGHPAEQAGDQLLGPVHGSSFAVAPQRSAYRLLGPVDVHSGVVRNGSAAGRWPVVCDADHRADSGHPSRVHEQQQRHLGPPGMQGSHGLVGSRLGEAGARTRPSDDRASPTVTTPTTTLVPIGPGSPFTGPSPPTVVLPPTTSTVAGASTDGAAGQHGGSVLRP
jgi:hypothetical protein